MSTLKGFVGRILTINLSNQEIADEILNDEIAKDFLGERDTVVGISMIISIKIPIHYLQIIF